MAKFFVEGQATVTHFYTVRVEVEAENQEEAEEIALERCMADTPDDTDAEWLAVESKVVES